MKTSSLSLLSALLLTAFSPLSAEIEIYEIDPVHSAIGFKIRHFFSQVPGQFDQFTGTVKLDSEKPEESSVDVIIQAKSINTHNEKRDAHLRSADFFDVEKFSTITFKSTKVERSGENGAKVTGDFTMHGETKPLTLDVKLLGKGKGMEGEMKTGWSAATTLDRKDYGLTWGKVVEGTAVLGDEVEIAIEAEANAK